MTAALPQTVVSSDTLGLHELPRDVEAEIIELRASADGEDASLVLRLMEIGFLPGEKVRVIARGVPGGDPLAVRIGHTTFALRRLEAGLIQVRRWSAA